MLFLVERENQNGKLYLVVAIPEFDDIILFRHEISSTLLAPVYKEFCKRLLNEHKKNFDLRYGDIRQIDIIKMFIIICQRMQLMISV